LGAPTQKPMRQHVVLAVGLLVLVWSRLSPAKISHQRAPLSQHGAARRGLAITTTSTFSGLLTGKPNPPLVGWRNITVVAVNIDTRDILVIFA